MKKVVKVSHFANLALIDSLKGFYKKVFPDGKAAFGSRFIVMSMKRINMKNIVRFQRPRETGLPKEMPEQKAPSEKEAVQSIGQLLMFTGVRYKRNCPVRLQKAAKTPSKVV